MTQPSDDDDDDDNNETEQQPCDASLSPVLVSAAASPDNSYDGGGDRCVDTTADELKYDPLLLVPDVVLPPPKAATALPRRLRLLFRKWLPYYVRFTSSASNQDKLLKLLQWSLWIWNNNSLLVPLQRQSTPATLVNQQWISKIYGQVSMARYVTRLLGFPVALEAALHNSWTLTPEPAPAPVPCRQLHPTPPPPPHQGYRRVVYHIIGQILALSMVGYHPTELMAYILWMKPSPPLPLPVSESHIASLSSTVSHTQCPQRAAAAPSWSADTWSYLSCRFWLAYVVAELTQCVIQWHELKALQHHQHQLLTDASVTNKSTIATSNEDDGDGTNNAIIQAKLDNIVLQGLRDVLFLVPCLQWSLPNWSTQPWLPVSTINTLMWVESLVCVYQAVCNTK